jgi:glycosyltransferase 2 family protein
MKFGLSNWAKLLFSIILVVFLFSKTDIRTLLHTARSADPRYLILAFLSEAVGWFVGTIRWKILVHPFIKKEVFFGLFRLVCVSKFYNVFLPGNVMGDIIRGFYTKQLRMDPMQGIISVIADRLMGLLSFVFLSMVGLISINGTLIDPLIKKMVCLCSLLVVGGAVLIIPLSKVFQKLNKTTEKFFQCVSFYENYKKNLIEAFFAALMTSLISILVLYWLAVALGYTGPFKYFLFLIPIIQILSSIPISYAGLGVREMGLFFFLTRVGLTKNQVLAMSAIYLILLMVGGILGGIFYLATNLRNHKAA